MPVQTVAQTVLDANSITTIINNINSLYSNAINQLITYTVGLLAFAAVFIPAIISYWQNRQFKSERRELTDKINSEVSAARLELSKFEKKSQSFVRS